MARGAGGEKAVGAKKARWTPKQQAVPASPEKTASPDKTASPEKTASADKTASREKTASPEKAAGSKKARWTPAPTRRVRGQKGGDAVASKANVEGDERSEEQGTQDDRGEFKFGKTLERKAYRDAVLEVLKGTCAKEKDFDANVVGLLDQLHNVRKSKEACKMLAATLEGMSRDHINNWKGYIYCLLKKVDEKAYAAWTEKKPVRRDTQAGRKDDDDEADEDGEAPDAERGAQPAAARPAAPWFPNPSAAAFVPGQPWAANRDAKEFVPGQPWQPQEQVLQGAQRQDLQQPSPADAPQPAR